MIRLFCRSYVFLPGLLAFPRAFTLPTGLSCVCLGRTSSLSAVHSTPLSLGLELSWLSQRRLLHLYLWTRRSKASTVTHADMFSLFEVEYAGSAVAYMANLPLGVNILSQVGPMSIKTNCEAHDTNRGSCAYWLVPTGLPHRVHYGQR